MTSARLRSVKLLAWMVGDRHIKRGMAHRHARRSRDHPADMLVVAVPHFHPERQVGGNVVQVGIGELAQQPRLDAPLRLATRRLLPKAIGAFFCSCCGYTYC